MAKGWDWMVRKVLPTQTLQWGFHEGGAGMDRNEDGQEKGLEVKMEDFSSLRPIQPGNEKS